LSANPEKASLPGAEPERYDTRVEVALPLRVTFWDCENKPLLAMACTYDISSRGARISGLRAVVEAGDIVAVERGKNKTFCRVVWVGGSNSKQRGQVGIQSVEADRLMWDTELREMSTVFDSLPDDGKSGENGQRQRSDDENRRKHSRFKIEGVAEVNSEVSRTTRVKAALKDLSELGCLISIQNAPPLGSDLSLVLKIENYEFVLAGQVRHVDTGKGTGIQFHKIRKGDRKMLQHLLRKLAERELEQSFEIELQQK
jgi:hypothetical protein